jgi:hypothetical protein
MLIENKGRVVMRNELLDKIIVGYQFLKEKHAPWICTSKHFAPNCTMTLKIPATSKPSEEPDILLFKD